MEATTPPPIHEPIIKPTSMIIITAGKARRIPLYIISSRSSNLKPLKRATIAAVIVPIISGRCGSVSITTMAYNMDTTITTNGIKAIKKLNSFFVSSLSKLFGIRHHPFVALIIHKYRIFSTFKMHNYKLYYIFIN